ncbi:MAG: alginate lyase family protein [Syntrophobacteraceae bacterium]
MRIKLIPLYLRTIAHLRVRQVVYRGRNAIRKLAGGHPYLSAANFRCQGEWAGIESAAPFVARPWIDSSAVSRNNFRFLNESIDCGEPMEWNPPDASRLWKYNLYYFDYLHPASRLDPSPGIGLIQDWVENNRPGAPDAWDPYPTSLRLVNWIKYLSQIKPLPPELGSPIRSAYLQACRLEQSIEYHLLGNHLFKNAKALVFCGIFFKGKDAKRWLSKGISILSNELDEQILPDGGHFERSPMYHSMILEDCLDLLNVCANKPHPGLRKLSEILSERLPSMMRFLFGMTHPDGRIALFNDAAFGIEIPPQHLVEYYLKLVEKPIPSMTDASWSFPESGYFIMAPRAGDRLIIDCGSIGPDYQPGHAHCDTLSLELSIKGHRVIVDSGCFQYEDGPIRQYNRGNSGHNTVSIDGQNQSEIWGAHRCARRAHPLHARLEHNGRDIIFEGAHNGYRRLDGSPVHCRRVHISGKTYTIRDIIEGRGIHRIESRLHVNPAFSLDLISGGAVIKHLGESLASISSMHGQAIEKTDGWYCPEFGIKEPCCVLRISLPRVSLPCDTGWVIQT